VKVVVSWDVRDDKLKNGLPLSIALFYRYHFSGYKFEQEGTYIKTEPRHQYTFWDAVR
jgi:hypothetical protein